MFARRHGKEERELADLQLIEILDKAHIAHENRNDRELSRAEGQKLERHIQIPFWENMSRISKCGGPNSELNQQVVIEEYNQDRRRDFERQISKWMELNQFVICDIKNGNLELNEETKTWVELASVLSVISNSRERERSNQVPTTPPSREHTYIRKFTKFAVNYVRQARLPASLLVHPRSLIFARQCAAGTAHCISQFPCDLGPLQYSNVMLSQEGGLLAVADDGMSIQ
ncbi:hypothetical protein B0H14DRAFT_3178409 [Mycena olivaceomarginata]|nr:hypothetical protein B0H14DRAFT_3178409 [Mycena olivaceomarginata]